MLDDTYWYSFNDEPMASVSAYPAMKLASPALLLPDESPDSLWHLFIEAAAGIWHFTSTSGLEWKREDIIIRFGRSPSIYREGSVYYLLYVTERKGLSLRSCPSTVMLSSSIDLASWSDPVAVLSASAVPYASYREGRERLYRPCLVQWNGRYRLYFGAGEASFFKGMPRSVARFCCADGNDLEGPYEPFPQPLLEADPSSQYRNLAVGSVRVLPCSDGLGAVECSVFYDEKLCRVRSAMVLIESRDGISWTDRSLMQVSPESGWASSAITYCDMRYKENEGTWYCYFTASGRQEGSPVPLFKESLGLLLGRAR